jgi:hypothetical protein
MKNFRGFTLGLILGLATALAGVGFAQSSTQNDANKKSESCCCMASGCGDSCAMKEGSKNQSNKHECCCGGDACNMKMKDMKDMKNKP